MKSLLEVRNFLGEGERESIDGGYRSVRGRILGMVVVGMVEVLGCSKGETHTGEKEHVEAKERHEAHDYRGLFQYDSGKKLYALSEVDFPCLADKGNASFEKIGHCDKFKNGFLLIERGKEVRFQAKDGSLEKFPVKVDEDAVIESVEVTLPTGEDGVASANFKIRH